MMFDLRFSSLYYRKKVCAKLHPPHTFGSIPTFGNTPPHISSWKIENFKIDPKLKVDMPDGVGTIPLTFWFRQGWGGGLARET